MFLPRPARVRSPLLFPRSYEELKKAGVGVEFKTYQFMGIWLLPGWPAGRPAGNAPPALPAHRPCQLRLHGQTQSQSHHAARSALFYCTPLRAGHEACGEELMEMRDFLKACFAKTAGKL